MSIALLSSTTFLFAEITLPEFKESTSSLLNEKKWKEYRNFYFKANQNDEFYNSLSGAENLKSYHKWMLSKSLKFEPLLLQEEGADKKYLSMWNRIGEANKKGSSEFFKQIGVALDDDAFNEWLEKSDFKGVRLRYLLGLMIVHNSLTGEGWTWSPKRNSLFNAKLKKTMKY